MVAERAWQKRWVDGLDGSSVLEHFVLRGKNLGQRALHEYQFVTSGFGKREKKLRDNFHRFPFSLVDPIGLLGQQFDRSPFAVAAGIIDVGLAFQISEQ